MMAVGLRRPGRCWIMRRRGGLTHELGPSAPALASHHGYLPPVTNNNERKDYLGSSRVASVVARKRRSRPLWTKERLPRNVWLPSQQL